MKRILVFVSSLVVSLGLAGPAFAQVKPTIPDAVAQGVEFFKGTLGEGENFGQDVAAPLATNEFTPGAGLEIQEGRAALDGLPIPPGRDGEPTPPSFP